MDKGLLAAILAPIFIAASVIFVNQIGPQNPFIIAGYSQFISVLILFTVLKLSRQNLSIKKILTSFRGPLAKVVISRALIGNVLLTAGFLLTTSVKAIVLLRIEPLFVFLWSLLLLSEKPTIKKFGLLTLLVFGSVLVLSPGGAFSGITLGDLAVMGGLLFLSYSYIPASIVSKEANPFGLVILTNLFGGVIILLASLFLFPMEEFVLPQRASLMMLGSIVSFYVIGLPLWSYAFKTVKPWVVAALASLETVAGLLIAVAIVGDIITLVQVVGASVVLLSTYLIAKYR